MDKNAPHVSGPRRGTAPLRRLTINGKFLAAKPTGVHRVARQLLQELSYHSDDLAQLFPDFPRLVAPSNSGEMPPQPFSIKRGGVFRGQLWEQFDLPRFSQSDLLLNLCNLGPIATRNAITMIHDAQVFTTPASYSRAFASWYRFILPTIGHRHRKILTVSEFSADQLARYGVAPREQIFVVPNGVDHVLGFDSDGEIIGKLDLIARKFVVALSNVQVHKNIRLLLDVFSAALVSDLKLVLIGSAQREDFEKLGHPVPANVVFAGKVTDGELRALLESALCVGFPSTTEGFGLPPLEGMILGCPAVMAPCGALVEIGSGGAIFAEPDNPRSWISAIRKLADEQSYWTQYSQAGRARARCFTWRSAGDKLIAAISEVVIAESCQRRMSC